MSVTRDDAGIGLVVGALLLGSGVALFAHRLAGPSVDSPAPPRASGVPTPVPVDPGDREMGRVGFRAACQECHVQGRQSFAPSARERSALIQTRVRTGGTQMPSFSPDRLPDDVLRHILAYIATPTHAEPLPPLEPRVRGVAFDVVEATGRPGENPAVTFRIRDDAGSPIPPSQMTALNLTVAGPTTEYQLARREDARRAEALPDGTARYRFSQPLPADAAGTFAVAMEGYLEHAAGVAGPQPVRDTGFNTVSYFAVTDPVPVPRRTITKTETCNQCHGTLALHGGTRRNVEFCVMCHHVSQTDEEKRTVAGGSGPPEPVLFRNLIHRIHTGEDLAQPFVIYGGSPAAPQAIDLAAVHPFPKDRANCTVCHEAGTFTVGRAVEALPPMTVIQRGSVVRQVPAVTATCTGCHDTARALAHAQSQTAPNGVEACGACHGQGRAYSVSNMHRVGN